MSPFTKLIVTVLTITTIVDAAQETNTMDIKPHPTCQKFTKGLTFNDTQAVGTWYVIQYRLMASNGSTGCVEFSSVNDQDRYDLKEQIGKFVENVKWENLALKMQIPCASLQPDENSNYYFERLEGDGSYKMLHMVPESVNPNLWNLDPHPWCLKIIEGQYLGMIECTEKYVLIFGKQRSPEEKDIDDLLKKIAPVIWPRK